MKVKYKIQRSDIVEIDVEFPYYSMEDQMSDTIGDVIYKKITAEKVVYIEEFDFGDSKKYEFGAWPVRIHDNHFKPQNQSTEKEWNEAVERMLTYISHSL